MLSFAGRGGVEVMLYFLFLIAVIPLRTLNLSGPHESTRGNTALKKKQNRLARGSFDI